MMLAADEGEALAHLEQDILDTRDQRAFQVAFLGVLGNRQKIELIRVLDDLLREIELSRRKCAREIRDRLPLAVLEAGRDLVGEYPGGSNRVRASPPRTRGGWLAP